MLHCSMTGPTRSSILTCAKEIVPEGWSDGQLKRRATVSMIQWPTDLRYTVLRPPLPAAERAILTPSGLSMDLSVFRFRDGTCSTILNTPM